MPLVSESETCYNNLANPNFDSIFARLFQKGPCSMFGEDIIYQAGTVYVEEI
jgi:hypothetical protein